MHKKKRESILSKESMSWRRQARLCNILPIVNKHHTHICRTDGEWN